MTLTVYALLAFNLGILLTVVESQYIPKTCQCPQAKIRIKGPFSDFKVTPKGPRYSKCTCTIGFKCLIISLYFSLELYCRKIIVTCVSVRKEDKAKDCKEHKRSTRENTLQSLCKKRLNSEECTCLWRPRDAI
uniref:Uncharacterized protein n=1 Tax=Cyprinus carpio TaxID=7962 RepID=A0A8C2FT02_CYPCA